MLKLSALAVFLMISINMARTRMVFKNINANIVIVSFLKNLLFIAIIKVILNVLFVGKVLFCGTNMILIFILSVTIKSVITLLKCLFGFLK